jgi:hypothetical protein
VTLDVYGLVQQYIFFLLVSKHSINMCREKSASQYFGGCALLYGAAVVQKVDLEWMNDERLRTMRRMKDEGACCCDDG